ncbi:hypothetical protein JR316_0007203 [Psilocybe cubensis]|uniref:Uncharacterized protein n=2 Tax=Psilocybe cubensis TaxID=181762 RepID=A0ACB8GXY4_PSICU|nr:hypothetical protein JR316_0007203 [Psilocybe cubensis]KAH9480603.1 hypothetical protein JR316_0007203 [Psilocybe cubensis]
MEFDPIASSSELPSYSPSIPSPSYSFELACGERLLEQTPRTRSTRPAADSVFIKRAGKTTIVLNDQEEGATIPKYGRQGIISGSVFFDHTENIVDVTLKIKGKMDLTISEAGGESIKLVESAYKLWSQSSSPSTSRTERPTCPGQLVFSAILPTTFTIEGKQVPLPPSYSVNHYNVPSLFVRCSYTIHLVITQTRYKKMDIWPKTKQIMIPFNYVPRTRAHRPIIPSPCFFSAVKTSPEEWYQAVTPLKTRPNVQLDPTYCHLFIPGARIYGLKDTIPFHVQLTGNVCSLQKMFSVQLERVLSADSYNTVASKKYGEEKPLLKVSLLRQVSVTMKGLKSFKNSIIGEGSIRAIPPDLTACPMGTCREGHVDWEGELRCSEDIVTGGFDATSVHVKDFISLTLTPPTQQSPLLALQITIPIRLVTDSCDVSSFELASR